MDIIHNIEQEIDANMDSYTQDLLVSNLDLLLKYCDRFIIASFNQKKVNNDLLSKLEALLDDYFKMTNRLLKVFLQFILLQSNYTLVPII